MDNGHDRIVHTQRLATAVVLNNLEDAREAARNGADPELVTAPLVLTATLNSNQQLVELILDLGFPVDQGNDDYASPLAVALEKDDADMALCLIDRGAKAEGDPNLLHAAIRMTRENAAVIDALVRKAGADINALKSNHCPMTALSYSVIKQRPEAMDCLLKLGADPNIPSLISKSTALHFACQPGFEGADSIVLRLLAAGADPLAKDIKERTPAEVARISGLTTHATLIEKHLKDRQDEQQKIEMRKRLDRLDKRLPARRRPFSGGA